LFLAVAPELIAELKRPQLKTVKARAMLLTSYAQAGLHAAANTDSAEILLIIAQDKTALLTAGDSERVTRRRIEEIADVGKVLGAKPAAEPGMARPFLLPRPTTTLAKDTNKLMLSLLPIFAVNIILSLKSTDL
jgi:hypothetical protein